MVSFALQMYSNYTRYSLTPVSIETGDSFCTHTVCRQGSTERCNIPLPMLHSCYIPFQTIDFKNFMLYHKHVKAEGVSIYGYHRKQKNFL